MIRAILKLPYRAARRVVRAVLGREPGVVDLPVRTHPEGPALRPVPAPAVPETPPPKPRIEVDVSAESTPNPNAMKFNCSVKVVERGSLSVRNAEAAKEQPLAKAIFAIDGVESIFAVNDFVTVNKKPDASWQQLVQPLEAAISEALGAQG